MKLSLKNETTRKPVLIVSRSGADASDTEEGDPDSDSDHAGSDAAAGSSQRRHLKRADSVEARRRVPDGRGDHRLGLSRLGHRLRMPHHPRLLLQRRHLQASKAHVGLNSRVTVASRNRSGSPRRPRSFKISFREPDTRPRDRFVLSPSLILRRHIYYTLSC